MQLITDYAKDCIRAVRRRRWSTIVSGSRPILNLSSEKWRGWRETRVTNWYSVPSHIAIHIIYVIHLRELRLYRLLSVHGDKWLKIKYLNFNQGFRVISSWVWMSSSVYWYNSTSLWLLFVKGARNQWDKGFF